MENLRMRKKALDAASWFDEFLESWVRPLDVFWLPTGVLIILLIGIFSGTTNHLIRARSLRSRELQRRLSWLT